MSKYKVLCTDGDQHIDIVYWHDDKGHVNGEVYFHGFDLCVQMTDSSFRHPTINLEYELHVPCKPLKSEYAILMVQRPCLCDRQIPIKVE